jgi:hypothetical protein
MQKLDESGAITRPELLVKERFDCGYVVLCDDPGDSPTSVCRPRYMTLGYSACRTLIPYSW